MLLLAVVGEETLGKLQKNPVLFRKWEIKLEIKLFEKCRSKFGKKNVNFVLRQTALPCLQRLF